MPHFDHVESGLFIIINVLRNCNKKGSLPRRSLCAPPMQQVARCGSIYHRRVNQSAPLVAWGESVPGTKMSKRVNIHRLSMHDLVQGVTFVE